MCDSHGCLLYIHCRLKSQKLVQNTNMRGRDGSRKKCKIIDRHNGAYNVASEPILEAALRMNY